MSNLSNLQNNSVLTMTSRDIAVLTGKDHKNVIRDIESTLQQASIDALKFEHVYKDSQNRNQTEYLLPKRECDLVVSGYSVKYRLAIIDRWQELENKNQFQIPKTYAAALQLCADQALALETARPAVQFVEKYVESTGNMGFRQVAKLLRIKENDFRAFLQDNKIMYKLGSEWMPYATHIDSGRFYVTTGTSDTDHAFNSAKFTPKGVEWISHLIAELNK